MADRLNRFTRIVYSYIANGDTRGRSTFYDHDNMCGSTYFIDDVQYALHSSVASSHNLYDTFSSMKVN
mgnify:CR=1